MLLTSLQARKLIEEYIQGWICGDQSMICAPLSDSCVVIESHGDNYSGLKEIRKWISDWTQVGKVEKWDVKSFIFSENLASFEWDFRCIHKEVSYLIYGASFVRFEDHKIASICEYKITVLPEKWKTLF